MLDIAKQTKTTKIKSFIRNGISAFSSCNNNISWPCLLSCCWYFSRPDLGQSFLWKPLDVLQSVLLLSNTRVSTGERKGGAWPYRTRLPKTSRQLGTFWRLLTGNSSVWPNRVINWLTSTSPEIKSRAYFLSEMSVNGGLWRTQFCQIEESNESCPNEARQKSH